MQDHTCHLSGTVPIIYAGWYLQFKRYRAYYLLGQYLPFKLYGTVPAIFAVPCPFCIRHGTCHFCGTMPVIYTGRYLPFTWYRACYLWGQYLQSLRYRAHSVYGTVPAIFAVPCPFVIRDGTVPVIYVGWYL